MLASARTPFQVDQDLLASGAAGPRDYQLIPNLLKIRAIPGDVPALYHDRYHNRHIASNPRLGPAVRAAMCDSNQ
jgi:hypothetical protein